MDVGPFKEAILMGTGWVEVGLLSGALAAQADSIVIVIAVHIINAIILIYLFWYIFTPLGSALLILMFMCYYTEGLGESQG